MSGSIQPNEQANFLLYNDESGNVSVEVFLNGETVWLTQRAIGELFGAERSVITKHLRNIFKDSELVEDSVCAIFAHTAADGKTYNTKYYNLDAIISVGYRVNSRQATQFRIWATRTLKEFLIKGFALDDERLKQGKRLFGKDYFDELLERIREIRASERRFYQKITDIYALSSDYNKDLPETKEFFASVQNKLHWAITSKTAAELIYDSADADTIHMGLTTWKHAPKGKILKSDVATAKNYLSEAHVRELNQIVSAYLDLAENRARRQILMRMEDWASFLNGFLELSNYPILQDRGRISAEEAKLKAEQEYETYRVKQDRDYISDFDREVRRIQGKPTDSARD
ncbi:MAG: virulence RhuM family protein [Candidatus Hydrogenedentes bacterium]|nr:virulence RhuM family protein [Candidatus Hydrogenedentota bacterium]